MKRNFLRGQIFTADFLIASSIIILLAGLSLHTSEIVTRTLYQHASSFSGSAEAYAEQVADYPGAFTPNYANFCVIYSNGTGNCTGFSCGGDTIASRRLVNCTSAFTQNTCVLEVRSCA